MLGVTFVSSCGDAVRGLWELLGVGAEVFLVVYLVVNVTMSLSTGRGVCVGERIAARVIVPRGVGVISVSAAGVVNGRYASGVIHVGPCLRGSSVSSRNCGRGRLLNALAVVNRHRVTRCSVLCARSPGCTSAVCGMSCGRARSCVGPRISVPVTRVTQCT